MESQYSLCFIKKIFSGHPGKKHFSHPQTVTMIDTTPYFDTTQLIDRFDGANKVFWQWENSWIPLPSLKNTPLWVTPSPPWISNFATPPLLLILKRYLTFYLFQNSKFPEIKWIVNNILYNGIWIFIRHENGRVSKARGFQLCS